MDKPAMRVRRNKKGEKWNSVESKKRNIIKSVQRRSGSYIWDNEEGTKRG